MTKLILLVFSLLLAIPVDTSAQDLADTIKVVKFNGATIFIHKRKKLSPKQLRRLLKTNVEAHSAMKVATTNQNIANTFGFAGGFLMGYSLGSTARGQRTNWPVLGVGAVLIAASVGFSFQYKTAAKRAVRIYNQGIGSATSSLSNFWLGIQGNNLVLIAYF